MLGQLSLIGIAALDEMLGATGATSTTLGDTIADQADGPGAPAGARARCASQLAEAIERMPEREKIVLTLYYYENLTLAEIGEVLGSPRAGSARSTPRRSSSSAAASQAADREPA